jgi:hypothetical protein
MLRNFLYETNIVLVSRSSEGRLRFKTPASVLISFVVNNLEKSILLQGLLPLEDPEMD